MDARPIITYYPFPSSSFRPRFEPAKIDSTPTGWQLITFVFVDRLRPFWHSSSYHSPSASPSVTALRGIKVGRNLMTHTLAWDSPQSGLDASLPRPHANHDGMKTSLSTSESCGRKCLWNSRQHPLQSKEAEKQSEHLHSKG